MPPPPQTGVAEHAVDAALLTGPWLLIARDNRGVGHVSTLAEAQAAVAAGRAATYAGRVRPHVIAIDLDLEDARMADYLVDELTGWCTRRDLWHVTVDSGGGPGRKHLFVVPERFSAEFGQLLDLLRTERRLTSRQVDQRQVIRPIGAPHRTGGRRAVPAVDRPPAIPKSDTTPRATVSRLHRRHDDTSPSTQRGQVTDRGSRLADRIVESGDRSRDEFVLTARLHQAGETEADAWAVVEARRGHAADRGRAWWRRYMWSRVQPQTRQGTPHRVDIARVILPTVEVMRTRYDSLDPRQIHTIETVWWTIAERVQDAPDGRVPISQRDLYLSTALDHKTVRGATRWLVAQGFLREQRGVRRDDAITWSFGSEVARSPNPSPRLTPPARTWAGDCPKGTATLALNAHLNHPSTPASTRQRALHTARQQAAARWHLLPESPARAPRPNGAGWHHRLAQVTTERDEFYGRLREHRAAREAAWQAQREDALAALRHRQRCWWESQSPAQQHHRRTARRDWLAGLDPTARSQHLARLRTRARTHQRADDAAPGRSGRPTLESSPRASLNSSPSP